MNAYKLPRSYYAGLSAIQLLKKLIKDGVIDEKKVRAKALCEDYLKLLEENKGYHLPVKVILSEKYNISERTVENIFYKYQNRKSNRKSKVTV